jgi:hypothetical protein
MSPPPLPPLPSLALANKRITSAANPDNNDDDESLPLFLLPVMADVTTFITSSAEGGSSTLPISYFM